MLFLVWRISSIMFKPRSLNCTIRQVKLCNMLVFINVRLLRYIMCALIVEIYKYNVILQVPAIMYRCIN